MWTIVHFVKDNTIEIVPDFWVKKKEKSCAWPVNKKSTRRLIEKRSYPNDIEYKWFPSRIVGQFKNYSEATVKANEIMSKTEISSCDDEGNKSISKKMRSPPKLLTKDTLTKPNKLNSPSNANFNHELSDENAYDSDKDPEYIQPLLLKENSLSSGISTKTKYNSSSKNLPTKKKVLLEISQSNDKKNNNSEFFMKKPLFETDDFNQENAESTNKRHYSILNSPIGKIVVEDNDQHFSHPRTISLSHDKHNKHKFSSVKRTLFDTIETDEIFSQENTAESSNKRYYSILNSPIGKIVVEDNDQNFSHPRTISLSDDKNNKLKFSSAKRTLFDTIETDEIFSQEIAESTNKIHCSILNSPIRKIAVKDNDKNFSYLHSMSQSNDINNKTPINSSAKTYAEKLMPNCDFQTFVINSLTKIKYDISGINSKTNATHFLLNSFVTNSGNSLIQEQLNNNQIGQTSDYYDLFPIKTEEDLMIVENRILDKNLRSNLVLQLSLLVGIKDVGDSVRRLMMKMFSDEVLTLYSLLGFKKKKNFSKLECYNLLIDALRVHSKFKGIINKEFDRPLATWIAHASFRLKSNKVL